MAGSEWGLNAWFADGEEGHSKTGKRTLKNAGYIVQLRNELSERITGKGTGQAKNKGLEEHLENQRLCEDGALEFIKQSIKKNDQAKLYFDYYSKAQRDQTGNWDNVSDEWYKLDAKLDAITKRHISVYVEGHNKAQKFITHFTDKATNQDETYGDTRDREWMSKMIEYCDKMIELINNADPSFKDNKLRNK